MGVDDYIQEIKKVLVKAQKDLSEDEFEELSEALYIDFKNHRLDDDDYDYYDDDDDDDDDDEEDLY